MNITIIGAAGFLGTNIALRIPSDNNIKLVDRKMEYFDSCLKAGIKADYKTCNFTLDDDYDALFENTDVLYHLYSTTAPTTSNQHISDELLSNVVLTSKMLEACVRQKVKKVVFISSGGTVYGKDNPCPLQETSSTNPISSYGIQKLTIEKLLYLYNYLYGLDYRIIRLANPYGPYQRPNGILGVVSTFCYKTLKNEEICIYGDGSVIRDFLYIDDAVRGIFQIANYQGEHKLFNLGSGTGTSVSTVIDTLEEILGRKLKIKSVHGRQVDVPENYLDISRYESVFGDFHAMDLRTGMIKTLEFMEKYYV